MCFSATANFVGSGVLGAVGVVTLTRVKHRRELLFRLFALVVRHSSVHRRIRLARPRWHSLAHGRARHGRGLHALCPGIAPFPAAAKRAPVRAHRKKPPAHAPIPRARRSHHALHPVGSNGVPNPDLHQSQQHRLHQSSDQQRDRCSALHNRNLRIVILLEDQANDPLRCSQPGNPPGSDGGQTLCLHLAVVRLRRRRKCDHSRLLLEKPRKPPIRLRLAKRRIKAPRLKPNRSEAHRNRY